MFIWVANVILLVGLALLGKRTSVKAARIGWALNCVGDTMYVIHTGQLHQWAYCSLSAVYALIAAWSLRAQFTSEAR